MLTDARSTPSFRLVIILSTPVWRKFHLEAQDVSDEL